MTSPPSVRTAHARLAAIRRHLPVDQEAIRAAQRDLVVAQAAALADRAGQLLRGDDS